MAALTSEITAVVFFCSLMLAIQGQEHTPEKSKEIQNTTLASLGGDLKNLDLKRRFDSIARHSSFGAFGKHGSESNPGLTADDEDNEYAKRKFDSIDAYSGRFGGFGKRKKIGFGLAVDNGDNNVHENRVLEENSPLYLFETNRSPLQVLPNGIVNNPELNENLAFEGSAFNDGGDYDNEHLVFTPLSSTNTQLLHITPSSGSSENPLLPSVPFRRLRRRHFDEFYDNTASHMKRKFDAISGNSRFAGFGKRFPSTENNEGYFLSDNGYSDQAAANSAWRQYLAAELQHNHPVFTDGFEKRRFDRISDSAFAGFGKRDDMDLNALNSKRKFDSISGISSFGRFGKREDEEKRRFDSISGISSFGRFGKRGDEDKRRFDSISGLSSFGRFGKRDDGEKRRFDSISGISSFGRFGKRDDGEKRRFDSISGISSFGSFGKREDEEKRKFDSISGLSSFGSFGKREDGEKRKFDSISGLSSFGSFGKREARDNKSGASVNDDVSLDKLHAGGKFGSENIFGNAKQLSDSTANVNIKLIRTRRSDSAATENEVESKKDETGAAVAKRSAVNTNSKDNSDSRGVLVKRSVDNEEGSEYDGDVNKRRFDRISGVSNFGTFGKRQSEDNVEDNDIYTDAFNFPVYTKRKFDRIGSGSNFGVFGKRELSSDLGENYNFLTQSDLSGLADLNKRRFDRIDSGVSGFRTFGKRRFDRISQASGFGGFGKRRFDKISGASAFGRFGKRRFDRISDSSSFHRFGRKSDYSAEEQSDPLIFESAIGSNDFSATGKQNGDGIYDMVTSKRRFDPMGHSGEFRIFGKRNYVSGRLSDAPLELLPLYLDFSQSPARAANNPELVNSHDRTGQNILGDNEYRFVSPFPESTVSKRRFDAIDHRSTFRRFGRLSSAPRLSLSSSSRDDRDEDGDDTDTSYNNINDDRTINTQQESEDNNVVNRTMSRELLRRIALLLNRLFGVHTSTVYYEE